jgi:tripartite-type tricarboxylate transporter receptor subunit TctC
MHNPIGSGRGLRLIASSKAKLCAAALLAAGMSGVVTGTAMGQGEWPSHPITLLVPYSAGSASDTLARTLIGPIGRKVGQPLIIENRPGMDGMIAGRAAARSEANGYTQYFGVTTSLSLAYNLQSSLGFDPRKDYAPVSMVGQTAYLLVVNSDLGVKSIPELVALARSKPGQLNFSSTGVGSIAHLGMLVLAKKLGIEMTHVPYKSTAQSIVDVASGVIQLQLATIAPTIPLYQAGKVKILGVASDHRTPALPDVPTLQEQGVNDFKAEFSMGLFLPAGTPDKIVNELNAAVREALADPDVKKQYFLQGFEPKASSPSGLGAYVTNEIETYRKVIAEYGIKIQ